VRYHVFPLLKSGVRYRMMTHSDHELSYFQDETLSGEIIEVLKRPWYRRLIKWPWMSWEIEANDESVVYYYWAPDENLGDEIRRKMLAEHPDMEIMIDDDYMIQDEFKYVTGTSLKLDRSYPVEIKTFYNEVIDSQSAIVNTMTSLNVGEKAMIQILMQPALNYQRDFDKALKIINSWDLTNEAEKVELFRTNVYSKQTKLLGHCYIRLVGAASSKQRSKQIVYEMARSFGQFQSEALNGFVMKEPFLHLKPLLLSDWRKRRFPLFERRDKRMILNLEELSSVMRLPSYKVEDEKLLRLRMKHIEPPIEIINLQKKILQEGKRDVIPIGLNVYRMKENEINLDVRNLVRHLLVMGGTGSGKSVFLENLMVDLMKLKVDGVLKCGGFLLDPHGQMSKVIISQVPDLLLDQVNYICPDSDAAEDEIFPFNIFDVDFSSSADSIAKNIANVLKRIWPDGWGVRPERNMLHAGIALQHLGQASLINVDRLLRDYAYCRWVADQIEGIEEFEVIHQTLKEYYEMMDPDNKNKIQAKRNHRELTDSTRNKLEQFTLSKLLRHSMGSETCGIRWREWMDEERLTILDLSKVNSKQEKSMFGSMALTMNFLAALTRVDKIEKGEELSLYPLIIDEMPTFIDKDEEVIADFADKTRFVKVPLVGAAQGLVSQMPYASAQAITRNFSSIISYQISNKDDSEILEQFFNHPKLKAANIRETPENYAYMALNVGRTRSRTFSALMNPPYGEEIDIEKVEYVRRRTLEEAMEREIAAKEKKSKESAFAFIPVPEGEAENNIDMGNQDEHESEATSKDMQPEVPELVTEEKSFESSVEDDEVESVTEDDDLNPEPLQIASDNELEIEIQFNIEEDLKEGR